MSIENKKVCFILILEWEVLLFKDVCVVLVMVSLLGEMVIILEYFVFCSGVNCVEDGDMLEGVIWGMLELMIGDGGLGIYVE